MGEDKPGPAATATFKRAEQYAARLHTEEERKARRAFDAGWCALRDTDAENAVDAFNAWWSQQ